MKRSVLLGIVGIAASVATSTYGQGFIALNNYVSSSVPGSPPIMFGPGSGGLLGTAINVTGFTLGMYIAPGTVTLPADPSAGSGHNFGVSDPSTLNAAFALGSGAGSTAAIADARVFNAPGAYSATASYQTGTPGGTFTLVLVAYNGANYDASAIRGHSLPFTMVASVGTAFPELTKNAETDGGFSVQQVPEPTTMALGGLGGLALLLFRRKKA